MKLNTLRKVLTGVLLTVLVTGTADAAKWKELVFTEDVNLGMAELTQYCMLHDITVADVLWANSVESADIKAGQSVYLPENHADMLAIWQHKGAWQPTALVPVTSAAAAKRAMKSDSMLATPANVPMPKTVAKSDPAPASVPAKSAETPAVAPAETPAMTPTPAPEKSNDDIFAQLREEVRTEARNFPPETKAETPAPVPEKAEPTPAPAPAKIAETPAPSPAKSAKSAKKKQETPAKVIANTAKPDKILTSKPKKSKPEIPGLMDPIIILSPNGDPTKGPMRLVISGDKVEVVQLPKSAAPKRPSLADLDHTFGTNPSYLPHYNLTPKPRDPFILNMGNLAGKMLWPVDGKVSSPFGKWRGSHRHQGIDIAMPAGTPIRAARNGVVSKTGNNSTMGFRGYGNFIIMDHGDGLQTFYAHCLSLAVVQGQRVMQGQIIAYVGSTGRSTGNHLHFEVRVNNNKVNPMPYLAGNTNLASHK